MASRSTCSAPQQASAATQRSGLQTSSTPKASDKRTCCEGRTCRELRPLLVGNGAALRGGSKMMKSGRSSTTGENVADVELLVHQRERLHGTGARGGKGV